MYKLYRMTLNKGVLRIRNRYHNYFHFVLGSEVAKKRGRHWLLQLCDARPSLPIAAKGLVTRVMLQGGSCYTWRRCYTFRGGRTRWNSENVALALRTEHLLESRGKNHVFVQHGGKPWLTARLVAVVTLRACEETECVGCSVNHIAVAADVRVRVVNFAVPAVGAASFDDGRVGFAARRIF